MRINTRTMQPEDIDKVYTIERAAYLTPWTRQILKDCLRVGYDCRVLELEQTDGQEIISYIICRYQNNTCHVLNLCVAPAQQGKGYGRYLLQQVIDSLANSVIDSITLEVRPSNLAAIHLYQKMGFQQTKIKRGYYRDEFGIENALVLTKLIQK